jgi:Lrp/AsnC family leucine-responsive transcriptional regulator
LQAWVDSHAVVKHSKIHDENYIENQRYFWYFLLNSKEDYTKYFGDNMLDPIGWNIVRALQENARLSYAELGRQVGLTAPAVAERMRKLEDTGVITGYHATVDPAKLGLALPVLIQLGMVQGQARHVIDVVRALPEVLECYNVTGTACFLVKAVLPSMARLETLIEHLSAYGQTTTMVILSTPVPRRSIGEETLTGRD